MPARLATSVTFKTGLSRVNARMTRMPRSKDSTYQLLRPLMAIWLIRPYRLQLSTIIFFITRGARLLPIELLRANLSRSQLVWPANADFLGHGENFTVGDHGEGIGVLGQV